MLVTLVHNSESGDEGQPGDHLVALVRAAGHDVAAVSTRDAWRAALDQPTDLVAIAGGDGTVRRVACALVGRRVPFAILPRGTANNIATALGLADAATSAIIAGWPDASRRGLDVLIARGPWGETCLIEGFGMGLFASTMAGLDARNNLELAHLDLAAEKISTVIGRLRARLADYPAVPVRATLDGRDISGAYVLMEALNIPFVGPNLHLSPAADPADGILDVVMVSERDRRTVDRYLAHRLDGRLPAARLPVQRGRHLTLDWTGFEVHLDDKTWPGTDTGFSLEPGVIDVRIDQCAVEFLAPASR
jgi:diacylglycerol kinase family enzyme